LKSHRQIFRSSAIIGGASLINIVISIIKVKVLAVLLGPAGIGLMGLYQSIMGTASTLAGCGMDTSGVRQIAVSQGDQKVLASVRRALLWGNVLLGGSGMSLLWLAREPIAELVFNDANHAAEVGWLGIGVLLSLLAASQMAILQGLRRIGDVARVNVLGSLVGSVIGVLIVWWLGHEGVHWFVISAPFSSVIFSSWYASRLPKIEVEQDWVVLRQQWQSLLSLGIPLMAAGFLTLVTQLIARSLVMRDLGLDASGYFQAAWTISITYIGFVLGAMGTDYLPRLTEAIHDHECAKQLVNEQTEMGLLMAAPVLLAMLTLAPWLIELLYAKSFYPAEEILRWQVMGDLFKVIGWPMGFIVLAQGRGGVFIATQLNWNVIYLLCLWFGMAEMGLLIVGVGFFVAYIFQVGLVRLVVGRLIGFTSQIRNLVVFASLFSAATTILITSYYWIFLSVIIGGFLTLCFGGYSLWRLNHLVDLSRFLGRFDKWFK
jgi:O-antigen/teichoic acid export membrane protein